MMVSEAKAIAALACEASHNGFESRQTPQMEDTAEWTASGLENRGTADAVGVRFLYLPLPTGG